MADSTRDDLLEILESISRAQLRVIRRLRRAPKTKHRSAEGQRLSGMDMIVDILGREGRPLHISDILTAVQKRFNVELDRESVVSAISKRVARHDRLMRTAPNTFALIVEREDSK